MSYVHGPKFRTHNIRWGYISRARERNIDGKLNYLMITQHDISFAVGVVSLFMSSPRTSYWEALACILRYLKGHVERGIWYKDHGCSRIRGFINADWAGSPYGI